MKHVGQTSAELSPKAKTEQDLLKQALERPGVREAVAIFERWQQLDHASKPYTDAMRPRRIVSTASASNPVI